MDKKIYVTACITLSWVINFHGVEAIKMQVQRGTKDHMKFKGDQIKVAKFRGTELFY